MGKAMLHDAGHHCAGLYCWAAMGVLLTVTKRGGIAAAPRFHAVFGWVVNILRSLPFLILMFFVIPFTRLVAGYQHRPHGGACATYHFGVPVHCPHG